MTAGAAGNGQVPVSGRLRRALASGRFVMTAEIGPPRGADPAVIAKKAALLHGWVDAANVTDNQSAHVRLSSFAGSLLAMSAGVEPVMQLTCRDRNRIALQSDLISAAALGIPNILLLTGDHPRFGDHPDAKAVFDIDGVQLVWTAATMRDQGRLLSGRRVDPAPHWLIGTVENPFSPPISFQPAGWPRRSRPEPSSRRPSSSSTSTSSSGSCPMSAIWDDRNMWGHRGSGPGAVTTRPGVHQYQGPRHPRARCHGPPAARRAGRPVADEGMQICVEIIQRLTEISGVAGAHVMAFGYERGIPEILERAGVGPRPDRAVANDRAANDRAANDRAANEGSGRAG